LRYHKQTDGKNKLRIFSWIKYGGTRRHFAKTKSLALPLPTEVVLQIGEPRIVVVLHLYYPELASEIAAYLANISLPFDLFISTDTNEKREEIMAHALFKMAICAEVRLVPNRGRDMAPKLITFVDQYAKYDLVLFIHSKQSLYNSILSNWRQVIMSQLLGTREIVDDILGLFNTYSTLGIVSPRHYEPILFAANWGPNWEGANQLAKRMGIQLDPKGPMDFPSGSMFWARPQALLPLLKLNFKYEDFELETGQTDGALGHQVERLFYFACEKAGCSWITIARPELFTDKSKIVEVKNVAEIDPILCHNLI
jgi:O-antigen biosynthesis protein